MRSWSVAAAAALLTAALPAIADVPRPDELPETCTAANHASATTACSSCASWDPNVTQCRDRMAAQGYQQRCRTSRPGAFEEVWCGPNPSTAPPNPTPGPQPGPFAGPPPGPRPPSPGPTDPQLAGGDTTPSPNPFAPPAPATGRGARGCGSCAVEHTRPAAMVGYALLAVATLLGGLRRRTRSRG